MRLIQKKKEKKKNRSRISSMGEKKQRMLYRAVCRKEKERTRRDEASEWGDI
jgi:hypothetical protein